MGFLAPLYIAGFAAIALPILFHLIRRAPQGRVQFSSLMFLQASPPRLTKRSRLTNILLLILRASAFLLLALAFARPFLHHGPDLDPFNASGRRLALLVDVSASMRRGDLWTQAQQQVDSVLAGVTPADEVELLLFDTRTRPAMTFREWNETPAGQRVAVMRARFAEAQPTWLGTNLGDAIATAADGVSESPAAAGAEGKMATPARDNVVRQVVLVSDLQQGGHAETLQGHVWPKGVLLEVRAVGGKSQGNAALSWVKQADAELGKPTTDVRVRVSNEADSPTEQFTVAWGDARGTVAATRPAATQGAAAGDLEAGREQAVYVGAGRSVIVRMKRPAGAAGLAADRLVLRGDSADFDNVLYVAPPRAESVKVVFLRGGSGGEGDDRADDPNGLRYYLQSALADTAARKVEFAGESAGGPVTAQELANARLVVVAGPLSAQTLAVVRGFAEAGGDVLVVMRDEATGNGAAGLLGEGTQVSEAPGGNGGFALIARVELGNPLFAPFADARFADFTKIHFWKHRTVKPGAADVQLLATFDSGDPFLLERGMGSGRVRVMTSGWQPADSQLALSTKFVPLMEGFLRRPEEIAAGGVEGQVTVGEPIALSPGGGPRAVLTPEGKRIEVKTGASGFDATEAPGIYKVVTAAKETPVAVNLPADESRTAAMAPADLERWGAKLGTGKKTADEVAEERRLMAGELENRQKLWRWLILAVLGLLALETVVAGVVARRTRKEQVTA
jgi:hypothetical protein